MILKVERNLYSRFPIGGVVLMALIDLALFGALGLTVWAVQMVWIPFWAAGVVNGLGQEPPKGCSITGISSIWVKPSWRT